MPPAQQTVTGDDHATLLRRIGGSLTALAAEFSHIPSGYSDAVQEFGRAEEWDWDRLPKRDGTYRVLSELLDRVRQEHVWFSNVIDSEHPERNRGYFDELGISAISGLPWSFSFIELHRLKKGAPAEIEKLPAYDELAKRMRSIALEDHVELVDVPAAADALHRQAMRRSFLEQLDQATLLGWESNTYSLQPAARRIVNMGGEELWNVTFLRYMLDAAMFEAYTIDLWQDNRTDPEIRIEGHRAVVSDALAGAMKFSHRNDAWYILRTLDDKFESLHPVHASRLLIGPMENRYRTDTRDIPALAVMPELLKEDPNAYVFRCTRQYAYAPKHFETGKGKIRQVVYQEPWADAFLVCQAKHAARIGQGMLGDVRVIEVANG